MRGVEEKSGAPGTAGRCFLVILVAVAASAFLCVSMTPAKATALAAEKWSGVDEAVIEKVAKEHGRPPIAPLINTDQGDLLLFLFLLAGAVGGFIAGYNWRKLTEGGGGTPLKGLRHTERNREG